MKIRTAIKTSYINSVLHGFWDGILDSEGYATKLALIHSEVSEALEELRKPDFDTNEEVRHAFLEELADVVIRTFDLVGDAEDTCRVERGAFEKIMKKKFAKNVDRPKLHGKRF